MSKLEIIISLIGAIATILAGVWWIVSKIFSKGMDKQHFIEFEKNVNNRFDSVENRLDSLEEKVDNHTLAIVELYSFLGQKHPKHEFMFSKKMSPRMLNELGSKIYGEIDGYDFLSKNKTALFEYIDKEHPRTKYDVQTASFKALASMADTDSFNTLKDYVYNAPAIDMPDGEKYELGLGDVCYILSIPLRDMYLEMNGWE